MSKTARYNDLSMVYGMKSWNKHQLIKNPLGVL